MKKFELFAQCDGQICKALFAERSPNVEAMVDLLPDDQYQELRGSQRFLRTMHQLLKRAYKDADEQGLAYEPDNYGGYDLVYRGSDVIKSGNKVGGAMGYLQKVPHDFERVIKPISFIGPTKYCNFTRIMAGPIRFANHSCAPNCVYEASEINTRKAVVLRAKQDLKPGDILTVHYCDRFFGAGNSDCLCPHTELHGTSDHMEETGVEADRRRLGRGSWQNLRRRYVFANKQYKRKKNPSFFFLAEETRAHSSSSDEFSEPTNRPEFVESETETVHQDQGIIENKTFEAFHVRASTPVDSLEWELPAISGIETIYSCSEDSTVAETVARDMVGGIGSTATLSDFMLYAERIIIRHGCSDAEAADWFRLIRETFVNSSVPSYKTVKKGARRRRMRSCCQKPKKEMGNGYFLIL